MISGFSRARVILDNHTKSGTAIEGRNVSNKFQKNLRETTMMESLSGKLQTLI